jgi:hypothetical protein
MRLIMLENFIASFDDEMEKIANIPLSHQLAGGAAGALGHGLGGAALGTGIGALSMIGKGKDPNWTAEDTIKRLKKSAKVGAGIGAGLGAVGGVSAVRQLHHLRNAGLI